MSAHAQIKQLFEAFAPHLQATPALAKKLREFRLEFMTKNPDHVAFFGGNLYGVQVVRFLPEDRSRFFSDIAELDEHDLEDLLLHVEALNENWLVSSDPFNQTCMWMMHIFLSSKLPEHVKHAAAMEVALILNYKYLTSILYHNFKYPAELAYAEATYARLTNKFLLKQLGTWQATLEDRAEKLVGKDALHYKTLINYNDDVSIIEMINDSQGRIKSMTKNLHAIFAEVVAEGARISKNSQLVEHEGDVLLRDKTKGLAKHTNYLHAVITDQNSFIRQEVLSVIEKVVHTAPPKLLLEVLQWCSRNYNHDNQRLVPNLIDKTMLHSFNYLENNRTVYKNSGDLSNLISKLKGVYSSSRSSDPALLELRDISTKIVKQATNTKNENLVASLKTALMLYLVIRAFTITYFAKLD